MNDTAAHLVDRVLPDVPVRQFLLSLPHRYRFVIAKDAVLLQGVVRIFVAVIFGLLVQMAKTQGVSADLLKPGAVVDVLHIIDGQQRLTTLQFVLASLVIALRSANLRPFISIVNGCLRNSNTDTMRHPAIEAYKLWPTFRDRDHFCAALDAQALNDLRIRFPDHFTQGGGLRKIGIEHPAALAALWYFTMSIEKWLAADSAQIQVRAEALIQSILQDLKLVSITLEPDDDAQIIFETLNGRGARLHATDLIRNYVFMRADQDGRCAQGTHETDPQSLYNRHWLAFETDYWSEETRRGRLRRPRIEWLFHTLLQVELRREVDLTRLYWEYRKFAPDAGTTTAEQQLRRMNEYAEHYQRLLDGEGESPIARFGRRIAPFDNTTLHPLAILISMSGVSGPDMAEMFVDLLSFVVRRAICGLTTKNYNNLFLLMLQRLARVQGSQAQELLVALKRPAPLRVGPVLRKGV